MHVDGSPAQQRLPACQPGKPEHIGICQRALLAALLLLCLVYTQAPSHPPLLCCCPHTACRALQSIGWLNAPGTEQHSHRRNLFHNHQAAVQQLLACIREACCCVPAGGADGYVRFYDCLLRLVAWFEDLAAGPVASLSFSPPAFEGAIVAQDLGQFVAPDFVVGTTDGKVRVMGVVASAVCAACEALVGAVHGRFG
jgi:hypothetical protein